MPMNISTELTLFEYLTGKMSEQAKSSNITISDDTLCYVGNLLSNFCHSNELLVINQSKKELPTLAFLYKDARETNNPRLRMNLLRKLGDSALFMGAWFAYFYRKKGIGKDYFVGMGCAAYDYLANNAYNQRGIYNELAVNLPSVLALTSSALARDENYSTSEIFSMYQQYLNTKDASLKQHLHALGIQVNESNYIN